MSFQKILVAYDGSKQSEKAIQQAIALTKAEPSSVLEVIHVYQIPAYIVGEALMSLPPKLNQEVYDYAESVVRNAQDQVSSIPGASVVLREGDPARTIVEYAEETQCDLIVIGSRGLGAFKEFVLGSVSHNVVQLAKISVMVVK